MRNAVVGIVVGLVLGVAFGTTVVAPNLERAGPAPADEPRGKAEALRPILAARPGESEAPVRWSMGGAFAAKVPQLGTLPKRLEEELGRISGGGFEIRARGPAGPVPVGELVDAVRAGAVDAAFLSAEAFADRAPALQLFAGVPFGPSAAEHVAWLYFGGGQELAGELFGRLGVHGLACGLAAASASGWFRKEIRSVDDLKGLRMRASGLAAKVLAKLGVVNLSYAGGEIFAALEAGAIDAAEFSQPAVDTTLGLGRMGRYVYYLPGWHQPVAVLSLVVNRARWESLTPLRRAQIEVACGDNVRHGLAEGEALQYGALKELTQRGVRVQRWPIKVLAALEAAWTRVAAEEAAADPDFRRIWDSLVAFRESYAVWRELSQP